MNEKMKFSGLDVTKKIRHKDWTKERAFITLAPSSRFIGMALLWYGVGEYYADQDIDKFGNKESDSDGWEYLEKSAIEKAGLEDFEYGDTIETQIKKIRDILIYLLEKK